MQAIEQGTIPIEIQPVTDAVGIKTMVLTEEQDFDRLQVEWDQLLDESKDGGYFLRYT